MGEVREEGGLGSLKKKHKKTKLDEVAVLGEDGGDGKLDSGSHKKKTKTEGLNGDGVSEVDLKEDNKSKKEKKKKEKREKMDKEAKKSGSVDKEGGEMNGEESNELTANDKENSGVINSDAVVINEEMKRKKDKKEKRKRRSESKSNDTDDVVNKGGVEKQFGDKNMEEDDRVEKKQQKEKVHDANEKNEFSKENEQTNEKGIFDGTEEGQKKEKNTGVNLEDKNDSNKEKKVEIVKEKKRSKKNKGDIDAGVVDEELINNTQVSSVSDREGSEDEASKKRKITSRVSNSEENVNANAGVSVNNEGDEPIEPESTSSKKSKKKSRASNSEENVNANDGVSVNNEGNEPIEPESTSSKKSKKKSCASNSEENVNANEGVSVNNEGNEPIDPESTSSKKSKKVQFDDTVEVFSFRDELNEEENVVGEDHSSKGKEKHKDSNKKKKSDDGKVYGKRFSKEEDEMIRKAVLNYIEYHQLGEEGINMVMKCSKHKEIKGCWDDIAEALPHRHKNAIYCRAHIVFERSESRTWTKEELEEVRKFHEKYGPKWRELGDEIGRNRIHVKDAFRQVKLANKKIGQWSQEEYQTLFNLVNKDLRIRASMERKSKHGMLRDNIGWEAISEQLTTRTDPVCCQKWYNQLTSALVACGKWADTDDYRLLMALDELDATCEEDVDWDNVLEHRPGDVCRKRWNEMVRHIGEHGYKSFSEQVELLSKRYCPDVLEARETYDNKPIVD